MSTEIPELDALDASLFVVEQRRRDCAREFVTLFRSVVADPKAFVIISAERAFEKRFRVPFVPEPTKKLEVGLWRERLEEQRQSPALNMELIVIEPEGEMALKVSERSLRGLDLGEDPFAQLVLDYFRTQYGD